MTEYRASEEDMKEYARLLRTLSALDLQREGVIQALASWEQAHRVNDAPAEKGIIEEAPAEDLGQ